MTSQWLHLSFRHSLWPFFKFLHLFSWKTGCLIFKWTPQPLVDLHHVFLVKSLYGFQVCWSYLSCGLTGMHIHHYHLSFFTRTNAHTQSLYLISRPLKLLGRREKHFCTLVLLTLVGWGGDVVNVCWPSKLTPYRTSLPIRYQNERSLNPILSVLGFMENFLKGPMLHCFGLLTL